MTAQHWTWKPGTDPVAAHADASARLAASVPGARYAAIWREVPDATAPLEVITLRVFLDALAFNPDQPMRRSVLEGIRAYAIDQWHHYRQADPYGFNPEAGTAYAVIISELERGLRDFPADRYAPEEAQA